MTIGKVINDYGKSHSPYMRGLVNHLPMGQLALYKMTKDLEKVRSYSKEYNKKANIDQVKQNYPKKESLEECLGKRNLYESCLDIIKEKSSEETIKNLIQDIVNKYKLGMSSGLFHTLIRLAYGVEGYDLDKELIYEIQRGLAYYITAYREANLFTRRIQGSEILKEMENLANNIHIEELISTKETLGQRMKLLYGDEKYLKELGFVIEGSPEDKIRALLKLLIISYNNSSSIVVLHCITGLHALIVLREYYDDFSEAIDILTTCIITHMLSIDSREYIENIEDKTELSWRCILAKGSESSDIHAIKLTYTAYELDKLYKIPGLKDIALKRIRHK